MAILNLWYSINKSGDTITISSTTELPINIKISIKKSCKEDIYLQLQEYNTNSSITFNLPYEDGKYKIYITNDQNQTFTYLYQNMIIC